MSFTLAIVGRPNVGKSSLFNRIAGRRIAIVHDTPGVTRDRRVADAVFDGMELRLIDTAGFEEAAADSISARMTGQTLAAIADADALLFVIDARAGVTTGDEIIATALHRAGKPVILAANKCEGRIEPAALADVFALGFGEPLKISAEHALGMESLAAALEPLAPRAGRRRRRGRRLSRTTRTRRETTDFDYRTKPLRLALVGRPNVGKSSLFNQLAGRGALHHRAGSGPHARRHRRALEDRRSRSPAARHGGPAQESARGGRDLGGNVGGLDPGRHPFRRLRDRDDRRHPAFRKTGPDHRRPDRARRPRHRLRRQQMGSDGQQERRDLANCAKTGPAAAAGGGRARWWRSRRAPAKA